MARSENATQKNKPKAASKGKVPAAASKGRSLPAIKEKSQLEVKARDLPEVKPHGLPEVRAVDQPRTKAEKPPQAEAPRSGDAAAQGGQASDKVKIKGAMPLADAVAQFEKIIAGLASGETVISADKECISLRPALDVEVEIKAARKKGEEKISLKMAWRRGTP
jgi:amphi-Trp domain-containing protein